MHSKKAYQAFLKTLDLKKVTYHSSSIKNLKSILEYNKHLNVKIILFEGRLSPLTGNIEILKRCILGVKKSVF